MHSATLVTLLVLAAAAPVILAQERRLVVNSFDYQASLSSNSLGLPQGTSGTMQNYFISGNRIHFKPYPNRPSTFFSVIGDPNNGCISFPSQNLATTFLTFRIQFPAGVDAQIVMQTGSYGSCGGAQNNTLWVPLSNYNALDGMVSWVRIPLIDFTGPYESLSGRARAVVFRFPPMVYSPDLQIDDLQFVSIPTGNPYWSASSTQRFQAPRSDGRCGAQFGNAGCEPGACCSRMGWCGFTANHCMNSQSVGGQIFGGSNTYFNNGPVANGGRWGAPRADSRCGRDFGWAGCPNGQSCSQAGFCGSTRDHFVNSQRLGSFGGFSGFNGATYINNGPVATGGRWGAPRADSRCGRDFGWAGCPSGQSCSQSGFCGSSREHFVNSQRLGDFSGFNMATYINNGPVATGGRWGAPRADSRCGRDFGWAGCPNGQSCSQSGFCGSSHEHFVNSQRLGDVTGFSAGSFSGAAATGGRWGAPRADSRCGRDFGWAGCPNGQSCSQSGFCGSSREHFVNSQRLGSYGVSDARRYSGPFNPFF